MCWLQQSCQLWHYPTFLLLPLLLLACIECFAGYHAWRMLLGINGAVFGLVAGAILSVFLGNPVVLLLGALLGAIGGAVLFAAIVPLGSVVFAFATAVSLTILVFRLAGIPPTWCMPAALIAGLAAAIAAVALRRPAIIILAAVAGAQQLVSAWTAYWAPPDTIPLPDVLTPDDWAIFLTLTIVGLFTQFATSRHVAAHPSVTRP